MSSNLISRMVQLSKKTSIFSLGKQESKCSPCSSRLKDYFRERKTQQRISVLSSVLMHSCNGITLTLGNLTVYTTSYIKEYVDSSTASESSWIISLYLATFGVGCLLAALLPERIPRRLVCILASSLYIFGMLLSYFTIKKSVFALTLTLGMFCGTAGGILGLEALELTYPWLDNNKGFATSFIRTASAIYGFVMNYIVTWIINPSDERSNVHTSNFKYFNQDHILERVPYSFLYVGLISSAILFAGCILIRENKEGEFKEVTSRINNTGTRYKESETTPTNLLQEGDLVKTYNTCDAHPSGYIPNSDQINLNENDIEESTTPTLLNTDYLDHCNMPGANSKSTSEEYLETSPQKNSSRIAVYADKPDEDASQKVTYTELLKSKAFNISLLILGIFAFQYILTLKYYKLFAQIWIDDDHFLTNLATVMSISLFIFRPFWGYFVDRFGVKNALVVELTLASSIFSWLYFTAKVNRWLYCVVVYVLWCSVNSYPLFTPILSLEVFGDKNFGKAYGLQSLGLAAVDLGMPVILQLFLENLTWSTLFSFTAFAGFVALLLVLLCFPKGVR